MRERISGVVRSFAAGLCAAALCALFLVLVLSIYDVIRTVQLPLLRWAAVLLAAAIACEVMAPRGLPLFVYTAVNAVIAAAGATAVAGGAVFTPASEGYPVLLGCMVAASVALCAIDAQKLPDSNFFIRMTDALLVGIALVMASTYFLKKPVNEPVLGFAAAVLALSLGITARLRAGGESENVVRGSGIGGLLVLGAVLGASLLICLMLIAFGGGRVDGIVAAASAVWRMLGWLAEKAITLLAALLSLNFGKHNVLEREIGQFTVTVVPLNDEQAAGSAPVWLVYGFLALLALALIAVIVGFLLDFRGKFVRRARRTGRKRVVTRKSHFLAALAALLRRVRDAVVFEAAYRFGPRTPQTAVVLACRCLRGRTLAKRRNESPGAYMRRLHTALCAQGKASALDALADQLDRAVYGGESIVLAKEEYAAYAAQIRSIQ